MFTCKAYVGMCALAKPYIGVDFVAEAIKHVMNYVSSASNYVSQKLC